MTDRDKKRARARRGEGTQLRAQLIDAAAELLDQHGSEKDVSIREVARSAGVTSPAIYLHFEDKAALFRAVCRRYFETLTAELVQRMGKRPVDVDLFVDLGATCVRTALMKPAVYSMAMMRRGAGLPTTEPAPEEAIVTFFMAIASKWLSSEKADTEGPRVALAILTAIHGVSTLMISRPDLPFGDKELFAARYLRSTYAGLGTPPSTPQPLA